MARARGTDRRKAQGGFTLIEVIVSLAIVSLCLALIVGTFSTGLLDATLAKQTTAGQAAMQYEMEQISASAYNPSAQPYSDCFATESPTSPTAATGFQAPCPAGPYTIRADASWQPSMNIQLWTITVVAVGAGPTTTSSLQVYKAPHR